MNTNSQNTVNQIYNILKYIFVIVPIVAGLDKFTNILTQWDQYINPSIADMLPFSAPVFMTIIGVVEIIAGVIVLKNSYIGGMIVAAWLALVAISMLISGYADIAVRDLVMATTAFSMAKLSQTVTQNKVNYESI